MVKPKPEQDEKGRFIAGNSGNGGRKPGSRAKLGEAFVADLCADWEKHGIETIARVRILLTRPSIAPDQSALDGAARAMLGAPA